MTHPPIERIPYIIAVVASFIWGRLVYWPLCGKAWRSAKGYSEEDMKKSQDQWMGKTMGIALVIRAIQMFVLVMIMYFAAEYIWKDPHSLEVALRASIATWLWFVLVTHTSETLWDMKPNRSLWKINIFWSLVMLLVWAIVYVLLAGVM